MSIRLVATLLPIGIAAFPVAVLGDTGTTFAEGVPVPSTSQPSPTPGHAVGTCSASSPTASVGLRQLSYRDPATGAEVPMLVWYPTPAAAQLLHRGPYVFPAVADGALASGRFPLVVLSHGSGGTMLGHHDTARYLASRGFVVVTPLHAGNDSRDHSAEGTPRMWRGRPLQLRAALDAALADPELGAHVDVARIGAVGFSAGGYTVLAAAGGVADLRRIARHCTEDQGDAAFCRPRGAGAPEAPPRSGDFEIRLSPDPRIRALVVMAPAGVVFQDGGLSRVTVPVRLYRAERDVVLEEPYHAERVRSLLPKPPEYVVVPSAGHYAFVAPFPKELAKEIGEPAEDPPGFDRAAFHERLNAEIAAFLLRSLPGPRPAAMVPDHIRSAP